jgi:hypothetical protein
MFFRILALALLFSVPALAQTNPNFGSTTQTTQDNLNNSIAIKSDLTNTTASVANLAALQALTAGQFPSVLRQDADTVYTWSSSACRLNGGAGDIGLQVKPTTGTGCWNATIPASSSTTAAIGISVPVTLYGAKCDNTTNDATAINAALTSVSALGGGIVTIPNSTCRYGSTITIPQNTKLFGQGAGSSTLGALSTGLTAINFSGNNSGLERLQINCGQAGANLTGNCVAFSANVAQVLINDFIIQSPYIGIYISSDVLITVQNGYIYAPTSSSVSGVTGGGGRGIVINGGNNQQITNVFTEGASSTSQPYAAIEVQASGQVVLNNNQGLWTGSGMVIDPGAGQAVTWLFDSQSAYDTGTGDGILINATNGGVARGIYEIGTWTSTMQGNGVTVNRDSSSTTDDIHFIGHRAYQNGLHGFNLVYGARVTIEGSSACGNSATTTHTYDGVKIGAPMTYVDIHNNTIGGCAGEGTSQNFGVEIASGANYVNISGNDFNGNGGGGPLGIAQPLVNATIENNIQVDDVITSVASAGYSTTGVCTGLTDCVILPPNPVFYISGTAPIENLQGGWIGRKVKIIPTGAFSFIGGGNLGNAFTATINIPFDVTWDGTNWYIEGYVTSVGGYKGTVTATQLGAALTTAAGTGLPGVTMSTIPTCNSGFGGYLVFLTDAQSTTPGTVYTGGGSNKEIGLCTGTNWVIH